MSATQLAVALLSAFGAAAPATNGTVVEAAPGFAGKANGAVMLPRPPAFRATLTAAEQDPATVEASLGLDRLTRRLIQQGLINEGFDPGAPDGLFGPRTRAAIRRWQESRDVRDVQASGYLNGTEAELLRAAGSPQPVQTELAAPPPVTELLRPAGSPRPVASESVAPSAAEPPETADLLQPAAETAVSEPVDSPPVTESSAEPSVNCEDWSTDAFFETATVEEVTACLAAGADPDAPNEDGLTPLHLAAQSNSAPAVIVALLDAGADLEAPTGEDDDATPVRYAATSNPSPSVLDALIVAGADLGDGLAHLVASRNSNPAVLETLLAAAGVDVTLVNGSRETLLHEAASNPSVAMSRWLLASGVDVNARSATGLTPLHDAVQNGNPAVIEALLAAGADVAASLNGFENSTPLGIAVLIIPDPAVTEVLLAAGSEVTVDEAGASLLHYAAANENPGVIEALLAAGADPTAREHGIMNDTPLHRAATPGAVSALVAAGADVDASNYRDETPLHLASSATVIAALIAAGADLDARDEFGGTALHRRSGPAAIAALVTAGIDPDARNSRGQTSMHQLWDPEELEALLAAGAHLEARDERGRTPLHTAAEDLIPRPNSDPEGVTRARAVLDALAVAGANLEARDEGGNTPLHLATAFSGVDDSTFWLPHAGHAIEALLDAGANAMARNAAGETPWDLAQNNEALKGSDGYWRLNDARFHTPRQESRLQVPTTPGRPQAAASSQQRRAGPACEIPGYPTPTDVQTLGLNWCGPNVSFQRRVFALQVAGAWCAISEGTSSTPAQLVARHREIDAACDALDALQLNGFPPCQCPAGYRP